MKINENIVNEYELIEYIYNFLVVDKYIIYEIFGYKNVRTAYKRLLNLEKKKMIYGRKPFTEKNKIYTTTLKANKLLNSKTRLYKITNSYNILHELFLSYIVIFFIKKYKYSYSDIIPNRISKEYWSEHIPDLLINKNDKIIYIEYERTSKRIERIENNIIRNNLSCDEQIWICENNYIYRNVKKTFNEYNIKGIVFKKEEIINYLSKELKDENYRLHF